MQGIYTPQARKPLISKEIRGFVLFYYKWVLSQQYFNCAVHKKLYHMALIVL